jgi:hypothetical protein
MIMKQKWRSHLWDHRFKSKHEQGKDFYDKSIFSRCEGPPFFFIKANRTTGHPQLCENPNKF